MTSIAGIVIDVVQIQTGGAQIELVRLVKIANFIGENAVNTRGKGAFMHRQGLVKVEMTFVRIQVKLVFKEVKTLQYIGLLDVTTAQNSVPTPMFYDRTLVCRQLRNRY